MNRLHGAILARRRAGQAAFVPFLVAGDPTAERSLDVADALVEAGADALEVGFPFSDPPADGPVIQAASARALEAGATTEGSFELLAAVRRRHDVPVSLLIYVNLVLQYGIDAFYARCAEVGVDAVLLADVPLEEAAPYVEAARAHRVAPVFIASALSDARRLDLVARQAVPGAYLYAVARVGITGEQADVDPRLAATLRRFRSAIPLPVLVGFGISTPAHVTSARGAGADGVIVGSALVRHLEGRSTETALDAIRHHARALAAAAHAVRPPSTPGVPPVEE